jgi:ribosomal protein S18 acetylase RimI-like enzyme
MNVDIRATAYDTQFHKFLEKYLVYEGTKGCSSDEYARRTSPCLCLIAVEPDGKVIGAAAASQNPNNGSEMTLNYLAVHKEQRHRGIGTSLLRNIFHRRPDIHRLYVTPDSGNEVGIAFYKSLGAEELADQCRCLDCSDSVALFIPRPSPQE